MNEFSRVYAKIDLDAIARNFENMHRNLKPGTKMTAVIKADGYGHGALEIGRMIEPYDYIFGYAVATPEEAILLREGGLKKPILLLGYSFPESYKYIIDADVRPCIFEMESALLLSDQAQKMGKTVRVHLAVDTGMSRIGFADNPESAEIIKRIATLPNLEIEGIFTHFARADEESPAPAYRQMKRFTDFIGLLEDKGVHIPIHHCSNSAGILRMPEANLSMVRAGITVYGLNPSEEVRGDILKLRPAMSLISHISYIKVLEEGVPVSYGGTFVTTRKTRVATIPVGYADGYPRQLSNKGYVLINGRRAPIMGRICMDQFMVDITDIPDVAPHAEAVLMGTSKDETITAEALGELSGRFNYELVCLISKRVPRVYVQNGRVSDEVDYFS